MTEEGPDNLPQGQRGPVAPDGASVCLVASRWTIIAGALVVATVLAFDVVRNMCCAEREDLTSSATVRIDINEAGVDDLMLLPGIGPARARAIEEERRSGGAFKDLDDLSRVRGISMTMIRKLEKLAVCSASNPSP